MTPTSWIKTQVFKEEDLEDFELEQNHTMGEADNNLNMRLQNHLFVATEIFRRERNLSPEEIQAMFTGVDERLKLADEVFDVVNWPNR